MPPLRYESASFYICHSQEDHTRFTQRNITNFIQVIRFVPTPLEEARAWSDRIIQGLKLDKWANKKRWKAKRSGKLLQKSMV